MKLHKENNYSETLLFTATSLLVKNHKPKSFILTSNRRPIKWLSNVYGDWKLKRKKGNFKEENGHFHLHCQKKKNSCEY